MNRWTHFFTTILIASLGAAIVYHLPVYFRASVGDQETRVVSVIIQTIFFTLFPIIPLIIIALPAMYLLEKYKLAIKQTLY